MYGNKSRAPNISAPELSKALLEVMRNTAYKEKSVELSKLCHVKEGRIAAADKIVEIARNPEKMCMASPEIKVEDPKCKLYEVKNRSGMTLQTVQEPKTPGKTTSQYAPLPIPSSIYPVQS